MSSYDAFLVGGEKTYAQTFISKALNHGIELNMVGHRNWDAVPRGDIPMCDVVIVLKDVVSHKQRNWARSSARLKNIKFCEVSQKIAVGVDGLRHVLQITPEEQPQELVETSLRSSFSSMDYETHLRFSESIENFMVDVDKVGSRRGAIRSMFQNYLNSLDTPIPLSWGRERLESLFDCYRSLVKRDNQISEEIKSVLFSWGIENACSFKEQKSFERVYNMLFGYYPEEFNKLFEKPETLSEVVLSPEAEVVLNNNKEKIFQDIKERPFQVLGYLFSEASEIHSMQDLPYDKEEFEEVLSEIRHNFKTKSWNRSLAEWQDVKYRWAQEVLKADGSISTMGRLHKLSRDLWHSRIADKYCGLLFQDQAPDSETDFENIPSNPPPKEKGRVVFDSFEVTLSEGSVIVIDSITTTSVEVSEGISLRVTSYEKGVMLGVHISYSQS